MVRKYIRKIILKVYLKYRVSGIFKHSILSKLQKGPSHVGSAPCFNYCNFVSIVKCHNELHGSKMSIKVVAKGHFNLKFEVELLTLNIQVSSASTMSDISQFPCKPPPGLSQSPFKRISIVPIDCSLKVVNYCIQSNPMVCFRLLRAEECFKATSIDSPW